MAIDEKKASGLDLIRVVGGSHAITAEMVRNRRGTPTVQMDFAEKQAGGRTFDWGNKLIIQLMPRHLPEYAAVLLGYLQSMRVDHYGDERNKTLEVEHQENGTLKVFGGTKGRGHAVAVAPEFQYLLTAQVLTQLEKIHPHVTGELVHLMIKQYSKRRLTSEKRNERSH